MSSTIVFADKNKLDISESEVVITASQGNDFTDFMRNRNNTSAWVTSGSVDADNTNIVVDFVNGVDLSLIALCKMNFKSYTIQYWNGSTYVDFSTAINVTLNTQESRSHEFTSVNTTKIRLIITGTMTANEDKFLYQFIATNLIGRLNGSPIIKNPTVSREKLKVKLMSGKTAIKEQVGFFATKLQIKVTSDSDDLDIIEQLYLTNQGFLVWLCGGDESQFSSRRIGYRKEDFFLMKCSDEYTVEWYRGLYMSGQVVDMDLVEVVD